MSTTEVSQRIYITEVTKTIIQKQYQANQKNRKETITQLASHTELSAFS